MFRKFNQRHFNFVATLYDSFDGVIRKNNCDLLTSNDLDLGSRSLET